MKAAILIGIAALAIVVLSLLAVRYALAPLARVERALHGRDPNDLSAFVIETPRELETIVGAINHFIHRLNRRVAAVQNFVADAAHQLRTPITAIRAQAELALAEQDPEKLRNINQRILDRSAAVGRLADQLLSKAMISHRSDTVKREPVDLRRVAMEAEEETRSLLVSEGDSIHLELPENPVIVMGDRFSLREAAKNMINNARAHGIAPYCMRVSANAECGKLGVHDAGPGIPMALRGSIGDRFATPLVRGSTGAGLGLAIVNEVAIHHGGVLACADCAGGFEVTLELPIWREPK